MEHRPLPTLSLGFTLLAVVLAFTLRVASLQAQGDTGTLTGIVTDTSSAPMRDVEVVLSGDDGTERRGETDNRGRYLFEGIPAGRYTLTTSAASFATVGRSDITVVAGAELQLDIRLAIAPFSETLSVIADPLEPERLTPASPATIDAGLLQHLPSDRSVTNLINLVPGIVNDAAYGGTTGSNRFTVSGVEISSPAAGTVSTVLDMNWIRQVDVTGLGAGADYGQSTGVTADVVLKSGSDRVSGSAEYRAAAHGLNARNTGGLSPQLRTLFSPLDILQWGETGAQLGAPLVRGRVWSYLGFQMLRREAYLASLQAVEPTDQRDERAVARVDSSLGAFKLDGFYIPDRQRTSGMVFDALTAPESATNIRLANDVWQARATVATRTGTLVDLRYGGYRMDRDQDPRPPNTRSGSPPRFDYGTGETTANAPVFRSTDVWRTVAGATVRHTLDDVLGGRHDLGGGVEYEHVRLTDVGGFPGGMALLVYEGAVMFAQTMNVHADMQTRRATVFASDDWAATNALTISGGIRLDVNDGSAGPRRGVLGTTAISPRIGAAWLLIPSRRTLAKVHYGRYHDPAYTDLFFYSDQDSEADQIVFEVGPNGELVETARFEPPFIAAVAPGLRQPAVDQLTASFEHDFVAGVGFEGRYIGRRFVNFIGVTPDRLAYEPIERADPGPDGRLGTPDDAGLVTVFRRLPVTESYSLSNPADAYRRYHAVQIVAKRRFVRGWQMQLSFTRSVLGGSVGNAVYANTGTGGTELGPYGTYVNPNRLINADGPAARDYELKALGTYRLPFWGGWNLSSVYRRQSGATWGRTFNVNLRQGIETIRAEPRRARRLPTQQTIDLRVEKMFTVGTLSGRAASVYVEAFNLGNSGVATGVNAQSGALFGVPTSWTDPRTVFVGFRGTF